MPPVPETPPSRIAVALTTEERARFLGAAVAGLGLAAGALVYLADADLAPAAWEAALRRWRPEVLVTGWRTPALSAAWLDEAGCPLRYVCHVTGSVRQLVPRRFLERGGLVTNWGGLVSTQVAEHALLLALAALRGLPRWTAFLQSPPSARAVWHLRTRTLVGRRVGIHGFGSITRALLPLLRPFDVRISAYSAGVAPELIADHGVTAAAGLRELFAESDVLFECEALTEASRGAVSAEVLAALPDDAVFVNIARGGLVDEAALVREAAVGRLRLALDVLAQEPITGENPFARLGNVVVSPHIGGPTEDQYAACGAEALRHLATYLAGGAVPALTLASYDRAT